MIQLVSSGIAELIKGKLVGNKDIILSGLKGIQSAKENDLTFLSNSKYLKFLDDSNAGCIIINKEFDYKPKDNQAVIFVDDAYKSLVKLLNYVEKNTNNYTNEIHPKSTIDDSAKIGKNVLVSTGCVIGKNVEISDNVRIMPNTVIYDNVKIDEKTLIHANVVIAKDSVIGKGCLIQSGSVIGSEGFGFLENDDDGSFARIPQLGNVIIKDNVEIGANTTIDRAMIGSTIIEDGVKLDNLIHIGHNCKIGKNSAFAAQVGLSGSVKVGQKCRFGGQVGLAGHLEITDDVSIMAQSGVAKSVDKPGVYFGSPIKERLHAFKIESALKNLPEFVKDLSRIKKKLNNEE